MKRKKVHDDPLMQLSGISHETVKRLLQNRNSNVQFNVQSIRQLRSMNRNAAAAALQKASVRGGKNAMDHALDGLYAIPSFSVKEASVWHQVDKISGKSIGVVKLLLEFQREEPTRKNHKKRGSGGGGDDVSYTLVAVLGSYKQRMVLTDASLSVPNKNGTWTVTKELEFDWNDANADGGEDQGLVILRLLWEEIRGFDAEMLIPLK